MADANQQVVISMTAQDAEMVAAWQRARKNVGDFEGAVTKAGKAGKKAGDEIQGGFADAAESMAEAGMNAAGLSNPLGMITKLVTLWKMELEAVVQLQKDAAQFQMGVAPLQRQAFESLHGTDLTSAELERMVVGQKKLSQEDAYASAAAALKEGGKEFGDRKAIETAFATTEFAPFISQSERTGLTSGAVTLQKQQPELTPREAVAQIVATSRNSESTISEVGKELPEAVGRMKALAPTASDIDLKSLVLGIEGVQDKGIGTAADAAEKFLANTEKAGITGSIDDKLKKLRSDPKLRDKLLKGMKDPGAYAAIRELTDASSEGAKSYDDLRSSLNRSPAAILADESKRAEALNRQQATAQVQTASRGLDQAIKSDPAQGFKGALHDYFDNAIKSMMAYSPIERTVESIRAQGFIEKGKTPEEQITAVQEQITGIAKRVQAGKLGAFDDIFVSNAEKENAATVLREMNTQLAELVRLFGNTAPQPVTVVNMPETPPPGANPPPLRAIND